MANSSFKCQTVVPDPTAPIQSSVSRWSDSRILDRPALIVVPESEDDVISAIAYAKKHGLCVLPAGGGHGSFVPIDAKTLYLDMKKFDKIEVDADKETVTFGGGVLTGQFIKALTDKGFYTTWVNSNSVGVVGSVLGGGNSTMGGLHGFMIDNVLAFRLVDFKGEALDLGPSSQGAELDLFNAIGAGHGIGVVTSMTMKIYPLRNLGMPNNEVWSRRLIFPATKIELAAATFAKLQPPPPAMNAVLVNARAPPNAPNAGAPMVVVTANYYGPPEEAEKAAAPLFDDAIVSQAIMALSLSTPIAKLNEEYEPFNVHGGIKDIISAWVSTAPAEAIKACFEKWVAFTSDVEDAKRSSVVIGAFHSDKQVAIGKITEAQAKYLGSRDRGTVILMVRWFSEEKTRAAAEAFTGEVKELYQRYQPASESPRTIANNMEKTTKINELYSEEKAQQRKKLDAEWNPDGLFWSPYKGM